MPNSTKLSDHGQQMTERLAMHVGLMAFMLQRGASLNLIQVQCQHLRGMVQEYISLDDDPRAEVQVTELLSPEIASAILGDTDVPDDLSSIDDSTDPGDYR